jgi:ABC-2 type transport system permease protein
MTKVLYRKLLADTRLFLGIVCLLLLTFEMLWAHVSWRISGDILHKLVDVKKHLALDDVIEVVFSGSGKTLQALMGGEGIRINHAQDMMSIGFVEPAVLIMLSIWAIGRSSAAIAGEIDRGTMELLLAQPIRRSQVILAHLLVDLTTVPLLCLCIWSGMWLGTWLVGLQKDDIAPELHVDPVRFLPGLLYVVALTLAINGYTLLLSAAGRFRNKVLGLAIIITLVQFLVNLIGQLWEPMSWMRPFTVFYHYQPQPMVLHDGWTGNSEVWQHLGILLGVAVTGYLLAWWTFCKRDLPAPL